MDTVCGAASSDAARVHDHVPAPVLVTAPLEAESVTVSPSGSKKVPVLAGAVPSLTLTAAVSAATEGAELVLAATQVLKAKSSPHWLPVSHVELTYSRPPVEASRVELVYQVKTPPTVCPTM